MLLHGIFASTSMYEVAPYTSSVKFTLVSPGKQHMKHATPQIYARYHAYPTLSEYDVTTAVNGNEWNPAVSVTLPKSGTWYVCVHVYRLVHKQRLPVAVQVNAQVLPHNECVERTHVSADGQHVEHSTSCEDEVERLQVKYEGSVMGSAIALPRYVVPGHAGHTDRIGRLIKVDNNRGRMLHLTAGSIRYFSFVVDPSLVGFSLGLVIRSASPEAVALAYLRQDALPQTSVFDMHPNVLMHNGVLDWHVRFPSSGHWYLGVFSSTSMEFTLEASIQPCAHACSNQGVCQLVNQGGGLVIGTCQCAFGYSGVTCDAAARDVTSLSYYTSVFLALLAPVVALVPGMYALYLDRYSEMVLFVAASAMGAAMFLSDVFALKGGQAVMAADVALSIAVTVTALISCLGFRHSYSAGLQMVVVLLAFVCAAWSPGVVTAPFSSVLVVVLVLPLIAAAKTLAANTLSFGAAEEKVSSHEASRHDPPPVARYLLWGLNGRLLASALALAVAAAVVCVFVCVCTRALLYSCPLRARRNSFTLILISKEQESQNSVTSFLLSSCTLLATVRRVEILRRRARASSGKSITQWARGRMHQK
jgi:hypothetical protein